MATNQQHQFFSALNAMTGFAGILLGVIAGYVMGAGQAPYVAAVQTAAATTAGLPHDHPPAVANEAELKAFRDILASDPKNAKAAVELANRLYDAGRFAEAVPYYQQVFAAQPKDVNVSTDLATALYYMGRADDALAQLQKSLAIDPTHAQSLFNLGIVRRDAKKDPKGAADAWERLLQVQPNYPDAARVKTMLSELQTAAAVPANRSE